MASFLDFNDFSALSYLLLQFCNLVTCHFLTFYWLLEATFSCLKVYFSEMNSKQVQKEWKVLGKLADIACTRAIKCKASVITVFLCYHLLLLGFLVRTFKLHQAASRENDFCWCISRRVTTKVPCEPASCMHYCGWWLKIRLLAFDIRKWSHFSMVNGNSDKYGQPGNTALFWPPESTIVVQYDVQL